MMFTSNKLHVTLTEEYKKHTAYKNSKMHCDIIDYDLIILKATFF